MPPLRRRDLLLHSARVALAAAVATQAGRAQAADPGSPRSDAELSALSVALSDEGVLLSYSVRFELGRELEQILTRGIAVVFVAEAELKRRRWYWVDQTRAVATRRWRLGYQPLTRKWRLNLDGLSRQFDTLADALDAVRRTTRWRIADAIAPGDETEHHIEFSFKLDAEELPRPLQIGLGPQSGWDLSVQRRVNLTPAMR